VANSARIRPAFQALRAMTETGTRISLLDRLRDGADAMAWRDFFDRYWRSMYVFAKRWGGSDQTAEEVVQEAVLAVYENRDVFRYDPSRGRFRNWLFTIVRQKLALTRRRQASEQHALEQVGHGGEAEGDAGLPEVELETAFENALLVALLDVVRQEVAPETYQAFELSELHGLSGAEVARLTGLSRNGVYLARRRVFKRLKELGASYRHHGELNRDLREMATRLPNPPAERTMMSHVETAIRSRGQTGDE
jgi:RNA polymerase sigma-70 factor (ECF subfamily)